MEKIKSYLYGAAALLMAVLAGLVWFFKKKSDEAQADALVANTKGQDTQLSKQQAEVDQKIEEVKNQDDSKLTDEQRANRWGK